VQWTEDFRDGLLRAIEKRAIAVAVIPITFTNQFNAREINGTCNA